MWKQIFAIAAVAALSTTAGAAVQTAGMPRTIGDLVAQSDLVFHGEVVRIDYRNAEPNRGETRGMPHKFVTYRVRRVLHGSPDAQEITLRFLGGFDPTDETYLHASVTPLFAPGDEDVLFVQNNGQSGCPLVSCGSSRLRIIQNQVYSDNGEAITLAVQGMIRKGKRHALPEVAIPLLNNTVMRRNHTSSAMQGPSDAMQGAELLQAIASSTRAAVQPTRAFVSADSTQPFKVRPLTPVKAREARSADTPATRATDDQPPHESSDR